MSFWNNKSNFSCLAPMEGVTDIVFRQVVSSAARPDIFFTEFTNVSSYASEAGRNNALERFRFLPTEQPIVAQIWGKTPEHFEITAKGLKELGFSAIDINMGCPDKHVVKTGGGSALIKNPELAEKIIDATRLGDLPVSVKTRLGYSSTSEWRDWLSFLLSKNLAALTIHLRTKKEMSKVEAHYELIPEIIALKNSISPSTKLIINGDVENVQDGQKFISLGADGIMIGRGIFHNPFCFEQEPKTHSREELIALLKLHLNLYDQYHPYGFEPLKRFFKIYINNFSGAATIREQLMNSHTTEEVRTILAQIS